MDLSNYDLTNIESFCEWMISRVTFLRECTKEPILFLISFFPPELELMKERIEKIPGVYLVVITDRELLGTGSASDERMLQISGTRISHKHHLTIAQYMGFSWIPSLFCSPIKAIVVDLDLTLYDGVIAEDSVLGITVSPEHKALQSYLLNLKKSGVFLAIATKNEIEDVEALMQQPEMQMNLTDFSSIKASWGSKSESIASIANDLRIGIDSILFIDDNPGELLAACSVLKDINYIHAQTNAYETLMCLKTFPGVWRWTHHEEDGYRERDLKANELRDVVMKKSISKDSYLVQMEVVLDVYSNYYSHIQRLSELSKKTNQFNLAFRRLSEVEIHSLMQDGSTVVGISLKDKFSNSGLIGLIVVKRVQYKLLVSELCISCRALGRDLEDDIIFLALLNLPNGVSHGVKSIEFDYQFGKRNEPMRAWLTKYIKKPISENLAHRKFDVSVSKIHSRLNENSLKINYFEG
jgi:FkbH-like protein